MPPHCCWASTTPESWTRSLQEQCMLMLGQDDEKKYHIQWLLVRVGPPSLEARSLHVSSVVAIKSAKWISKRSVATLIIVNEQN